MAKEMAKKILMIEHDAKTRHLLLAFLEDQGFYTIASEDSWHGIEMAQTELPSLIICDIMMPQINGYEVLHKLRQNQMTAIIPLIFITTQGSWTDFRKAMELGADDYLVKPFNLDELLKAITACLEKHFNLQKWYAQRSYQSLKPSSIDTETAAINPKSILPSIPKLKEVFDFIEANYHQPISLCDVAQAVGYSPTYLTNLVRCQTGQTVYSWIVQRRMAEAHSLLLNTEQPVHQIAAAVGYPDSGHFIRQFRKLHHTTPKTWRKVHRN